MPSRFPLAIRFWMSVSCPTLRHPRDRTRRVVPHAKRIRRQATCTRYLASWYSSLVSFGMTGTHMDSTTFAPILCLAANGQDCLDSLERGSQKLAFLYTFKSC